MSSNLIELAGGQIFDEVIDPSELALASRPEGVILDAEFKTEAVSFSKDVWRRFRRDKVTVTASIFVLFIIFMAIVGPHMNGFSYREQNPAFQFLPPRFPVVENLGIFAGARHVSVQYEHLYRWDDYIIRVAGTHERFVRVGQPYVTMADIVFNVYYHRGAEDTYHWFGTDILGRDLFTRLWQGTRVSLIIGIGVGLFALIMGIILGSIMGYYGGWVDLIMQRIMEIILYIPFIPLAILLIMRFGSGINALIIIFSIFNWIGPAQGVRMQFYRFKGREYVLASRTMGASDFRIMFKHILPNAAGFLITSLVLVIPLVIFAEAGLSYLGLGIQAPAASIGSLLSDGQTTLTEFPFMIASPAAVIVILMLAFNLFGNGLRDAFDPSLRQ